MVGCKPTRSELEKLPLNPQYARVQTPVLHEMPVQKRSVAVTRLRPQIQPAPILENKSVATSNYIEQRPVAYRVEPVKNLPSPPPGDPGVEVKVATDHSWIRPVPQQLTTPQTVYQQTPPTVKPVQNIEVLEAQADPSYTMQYITVDQPTSQQPIVPKAIYQETPPTVKPVENIEVLEAQADPGYTMEYISADEPTSQQPIVPKAIYQETPTAVKPVQNIEVLEAQVDTGYTMEYIAVDEPKPLKNDANVVESKPETMSVPEPLAARDVQNTEVMMVGKPLSIVLDELPEVSQKTQIDAFLTVANPAEDQHVLLMEDATVLPQKQPVAKQASSQLHEQAVELSTVQNESVKHVERINIIQDSGFALTEQPSIIEPQAEPQIVQDVEPDHPEIRPESYEVQKGDTLWSIATRFYGNGSHWMAIARHNRIYRADRISSGMVLRLP
tara:strand:+ start:26250 stop:27578 length:1329 start_codon:yes stop_codon:yes gene_type:complete